MVFAVICDNKPMGRAAPAPASTKPQKDPPTGLSERMTLRTTIPKIALEEHFISPASRTISAGPPKHWPIWASVGFLREMRLACAWRCFRLPARACRPNPTSPKRSRAPKPVTISTPNNSGPKRAIWRACLPAGTRPAGHPELWGQVPNGGNRQPCAAAGFWRGVCPNEPPHRSTPLKRQPCATTTRQRSSAFSAPSIFAHARASSNWRAAH